MYLITSFLSNRSKAVFFPLLLYCNFTIAQNQILVETGVDTAITPQAYGRFAESVGISEDYAIAGAPGEPINGIKNAGAIYFFTMNSNGQWVMTQRIASPVVSEDFVFGIEVAIWHEHAAVTASDTVYMLKRDSTNNLWYVAQKIQTLGTSLCLYERQFVIGNYFDEYDVNGMNYLDRAGAVYVFELDSNGVWNFVQKMVASDRKRLGIFGVSVDLHGKYLIAGTFAEYENEFGQDSLNRAGAAYIFEQDTNGIWQQKKKLVPSDRRIFDHFGSTVQIWDDYVVVSSHGNSYNENDQNYVINSGSVYAYKKNQLGEWEEVQKITAPQRTEYDGFGYSLDVYDDQLLIGAYGEDEDENNSNFVRDAGAIYFYQRTCGDHWNLLEKNVSSTRVADGRFGDDISMWEHEIIIGAPNTRVFHPTNPEGVVYFFRRISTPLPINAKPIDTSVLQPGSIIIDISATFEPDSLCATSVYGSSFFTLLNCDSVLFLPDSSFVGNDTCYYILYDSVSTLCDTGIIIVTVIPDSSLYPIADFDWHCTGSEGYFDYFSMTNTSLNDTSQSARWIIRQGFSGCDTITQLSGDTVLEYPINTCFDAPTVPNVCLIVSNQFGSDTVCKSLAPCVFIWEGIDEVQPLLVRIFPNPAKNYATIITDERMIGGIIQLTDFTGKELASIEIKTKEQLLKTNEFNSGLYFAKFTSIKGNTGVLKLLIE